MIIVKIMGGLGNQMFQYAFGRRLALERGVPLKLDITWFEEQKLRSYQLDAFNIKAEIASQEEIEEFTHSHMRGIQGRVIRAIQRRSPTRFNRVISEKSTIVDSQLIKHIGRNNYLIGYWQSEKYFAPISSMLREEFDFKGQPSSDFCFWKKRIGGVSSVSLHIRRGDYVNDPYTNQIHGTCSMAYYSDAIRYIRQRIPDITIFVFSDDLDWAHKNLAIYSPINFIEVQNRIQDYEEMVLMSLCDYHIIANSSFSWWGAWLDNKIGKIVVAPQKWFNDSSLDVGDLTPDNWIRM